MNKTETLASLTDLEKIVINNMFVEGFATDDPDNRFMSYGVDGKQERGALASLVKKGIVWVEPDKSVYLDNGYTKRELLAAVKDICATWLKDLAAEWGC